MSAPLPRGTRRAYELLRRDVLRWQSAVWNATAKERDVLLRAAFFVKAMETARVRARRSAK